MLTVTLQLTEEEAELSKRMARIFYYKYCFDEWFMPKEMKSLEAKMISAVTLAQQVRKLNPDSDWG